jgi:hypothetical protein
MQCLHHHLLTFMVPWSQHETSPVHNPSHVAASLIHNSDIACTLARPTSYAPHFRGLADDMWYPMAVVWAEINVHTCTAFAHTHSVCLLCAICEGKVQDALAQEGS